MYQAKKRTLISETPKFVNKEVVLKGWVKTRRDHGKLIFLDIRDRSGIVQVKASASDRNVLELRPQDVVHIVGMVVKRPEHMFNKRIPTGEIEIQPDKDGIEILSKAEALPFDLDQEHLHLELPTLLDYRSLTLRHPKVAAIFKVQETIVQSYRNSLKEEGFTEVFVPTIVPSTTEGGAQVFEIKYYDHKAYLGQSPQLYKQIMVGVFERVFTIAHAYRAEPSVTTRHLSEYVSLDAECGFIDSWQELMDMAEKVVKNIITDVLKDRVRELAFLEATPLKPPSKIPRLKLREAQEIVFKRTKVDHRGQPDLDPADEKEICKWAEEENNSPFVFITHYPTKKRPFYTMPDPKDLDFTLSFDLLGVNEEWVTGGQRINDYAVLLNHVKQWGNKPEDFEIYLQAFRYGMPPEGGFAMGLERITKDIVGVDNIREASLFPRDMERVDERLSAISSESKKTG